MMSPSDIDTEELSQRLDLNLLRLLNEFSEDYNRRVLEEIHELGYTDVRRSHSAVFDNLGLEAMRVTDLANRARVTQQAMGKMLKELERIGYVTRDISGDDRRARSIRLTEKGVRLIHDCLAAEQRVYAWYAHRFGGDDMQQLEAILRRGMSRIELAHMPEDWR